MKKLFTVFLLGLVLTGCSSYSYTKHHCHMTGGERTEHEVCDKK